VNLLNFKEKTKIFEVDAKGYIHHMENIEDSEFLVLACSNQVKIITAAYGVAISDRIIYKRAFPVGVTRLRYSMVPNKIFYHGIGFAKGMRFLEL
jgi:hypothetical protein